MTALSPSRPPFPNLATKSTSTAQSSQLNALADNKGASGRPSSRTVPVTTKPQPESGTSSEAATSERATSNLIRKTLVSEGQHATSDLRSTSPTLIDAILPPLTSSNDIDVQLYAIVAIIIKDFVNSWYTKITPDRVFVDEVVQIIAHCSRAVEQRIRGIDMSELILDELPSVVERHVIAYRTASATSAALQYGDSPRRVYHALNPHPALDPSLPEDDRLNHESAYRQLLVQGALALLLPTEDLTNACLRALVTDIIADLILGRAVADRLCQPWFIHGIVSKLVEVVTSSAIGETHADQSSSQKHDRMSRLEKFGLLPSNNAVQPLDSPVKHQSPFSAWAWRLLQYVFVAYQTIRFFLLGMARARHLPRRSYHQQHQHPQRVKSLSTLSSSSSSRSTEPPTSSMQRHHDASHLPPRAVLDYRLFSCISTILDLSLRMPWLLAGFSFWQHLLCAGPGKHGAVDSTLDKFLYHSISTRLFTPNLLPALLLQIRAILFPNNTMGPPAPPAPTPEEQVLIRRKAASDLVSLIPPRIARNFFSAEDDEDVVDEVEEVILGWTDDLDLNKYLVYGLLETIILKICPEMMDKTPTELLAERGVTFAETEAEDVDDVKSIESGLI